MLTEATREEKGYGIGNNFTYTNHVTHYLAAYRLFLSEKMNPSKNLYGRLKHLGEQAGENLTMEEKMLAIQTN